MYYLLHPSARASERARGDGRNFHMRLLSSTAPAHFESRPAPAYPSPPPAAPDIKVKEPDFDALMRGRRAFLPPRYMTVAQAASQLLEVEADRGEGGALPPNPALCAPPKRRDCSPGLPPQCAAAIALASGYPAWASRHRKSGTAR